MTSYDQWKTASPYDNDPDPVQEAEKALKSYRWAKMNWEQKPGPWEHHLNQMEQVIEMLLTFIEENI